MKYYPILYSRSLTRDYRWILLPEILQPESVRLLRDLYNTYDDSKEKSSAVRRPWPTLVNLDLGDSIALLLFSPIADKDNLSRVIYSMQGMVIQNEDRRMFSGVLPYLLDKYASTLNVWEQVGFEEADKLNRQSKKLEFSIDRLHDDRSTRILGLQRGLLPSRPSRRVQVPHTEEGFTILLSYALSSDMPLFEFGFGISSQALTLFDPALVAMSPSYRELREQDSGRRLEPGAMEHIDTSAKRGNVGPQPDSSTAAASVPLRSSVPDSVSSEQTQEYQVCEIYLDEISSGAFDFWRGRQGQFILRDNYGIWERSRSFRLPSARGNRDDEIAMEMQRAHADFQDQLKQLGWEPLPGIGAHWYNTKMKRRRQDSGRLALNR